MNQLKLNKSNHFKLPTGVLGASLSADGGNLVAGSMDGIYLANLEAKSFERIGQHASYVSSVAWIPDQNVIVSAGYDGVLQWIDASNHEQQRHIQVHDFWSWDMAISPDQSMIASVTGQYLAGGYKYEPQPEREPSVKLLAAATGEVLHQFEHVPSVQAVTFSPDSQFVAAGNLMGEVRIWNCQSGEELARWTTADFTSWGIIKSHCYLGGIFAMQFTPDGQELLLAGMGPMRDPMAGNGRQLWQKWSWTDSEPQKVAETLKKEAGEGLMETLALHPTKNLFVMGGRLRGGDWNVAVFDLATGTRQATLKTGYRVTEALFTADGQQLVLVGTQGQPGPNKMGDTADFGRVEIYDFVQN